MGANGSKDASSRSSSLQSIHLKNKPQDLVDLGTVFPNGLYSTSPQDFDSRMLRQLILTRKMSPFYTGLADAPEQVTAICHLPKLQPSTSLSPSPSPNVSHHGRPRSASNRSDKMSRQGEKEPSHSERMKIQKAMLYNDAVECPICFLYYPPNINYSRCCDQPICTECFIQIHRPTDDPSSPATCPFCLESNYGVTYVPPAWSEKPKRLRSFSSSSSLSASYYSSLPPSVPSSGARHTTSGVSDGVKPRRKSINHTDPTVVLTDHIRPNWNKPAPPSTSSRSSRRNSLSSTGNTSSSAGRNLLRVVTRPGRSASSAASTEYSQYLATVRDMNMDLEEWMVMEAIRLSLSEQQDEQAHNNDNNNNSQQPSSSLTAGTTRSSPLPPLPQERTTEQVVAETPTSSTTTPQRQVCRDDDDEQPLALRAQQYQQDTLYSSPSVSSSSSASSSQASLDTQGCTLDKKSVSEHESPTFTTTTPTAATTTTTTTTTSTPDIVC
ncbi:hypothetical protein BCR42DRAFT_408381 [Absidia repens]|uniref:RING-type domain-containing protein n=1 Tax=Absidia repens TaxID=90262 RepID=A0A1X2IPT7_9FUNG|nr:hypothetical protein BCR42DRAFT_408381 [Absidia repens]